MDKNKSRKFLLQVKRLAKKYKLPFFIVTDGASMIDNDGCEAVDNARKAHEKWEKKHGYDSKENWENSLDETNYFPY